MTRKGHKADRDKARWDLLPWDAAGQVVEVLTFGARKYAPDNWKRVPEPQDRYFAAAMRHIVAWRNGQQDDPETGLPHLAHATCCLMFLLSKETSSK